MELKFGGWFKWDWEMPEPFAITFYPASNGYKELHGCHSLVLTLTNNTLYDAEDIAFFNIKMWHIPETKW